MARHLPEAAGRTRPYGRAQFAVDAAGAYAREEGERPVGIEHHLREVGEALVM